jgi:hypothetical protein
VYVPEILFGEISTGDAGIYYYTAIVYLIQALIFLLSQGRIKKKSCNAGFSEIRGNGYC